jgi:N-methylhydantoinase A/oxoprolinase/acetone carboxylase beta subunit
MNEAPRSSSVVFAGHFDMRVLTIQERVIAGGGETIVDVDENGHTYIGPDTVTTTFYPDGCYVNGDTPNTAVCTGTDGSVTITNIGVLGGDSSTTTNSWTGTGVDLSNPSSPGLDLSRPGGIGLRL